MTSNARELAQIPALVRAAQLDYEWCYARVQRSTSLTNQTSVNAVFIVDRFHTEISGPTSFDIARVTDSPDEFSYSLKVTINGAFLLVQVNT